MSVVFVYALVDPRTEQVRYVGKSIKPTERLEAHLGELRVKRDYKNADKVRWLNELSAEGLQPDLRILEEVQPATWRERELWWINHYRTVGEGLTNREDRREHRKRTYPPSPFSTPDQVAARLQVTRRTVYRWIEEGKLKALKALKAGGRVRIAESAVQAFMQEPQEAEEGPR